MGTTKIKKESDLQKYISSDLKKKGIKFLHLESYRGHKHNKGKAGWPDLMIFPKYNKVYFIELKMQNKQLSEDQILFYKWAMEMKYLFVVIRSVLEWNIFKTAYLS